MGNSNKTLKALSFTSCTGPKLLLSGLKKIVVLGPKIFQTQNEIGSVTMTYGTVHIVIISPAM